MAIDITIRSDVFDRRAKKILGVLSPSTLLRVVSQQQLTWIDQNFRRQGIEKRWKRLAPGTVEARRRGSSRILQDTGKLKQSFSTAVGGSTAKVGTLINYAEFHDQGTRPYQIFPVNRKFLTIPDPSGPVVFSQGRLAGKRGFFSKGVNHPGLPQRQLLPSKALAERLAERTIVAVIKKAAG